MYTVILKAHGWLGLYGCVCVHYYMTALLQFFVSVDSILSSVFCLEL